MQSNNECKINNMMDKSELLDAIRKDIMGELDAIIHYDRHIRSTDDKMAKAVWTDIRDEERVHVGELFTLLATLSPDEAKYFAEGEKEVREILRDMRYDI
ncbi:MAG: ubiquinone biosynthesis protein COQ7 [Clostridia bacterium]|nr:ubiquinone biosynthesis protein COQ7 [Clostridia bacterium]